MKKWLLVVLVMTGCSIQNFDYRDIPNERFIEWSEIFQPEDHFVYVFSYTCPHCESIKNSVLSFLLHKADSYYLVEGTSEIPKNNNPLSSLEAETYTQVAIRGYPTLLRMEGGKLISIWTGTTEILTYLDA